MSRKKNPKYEDCIVSAEEFDGNTGIEELVANYQAQKPCKLTVNDRIEMMHAEGKMREDDTPITKKCGRCGRVLPLSHFYRSSRNSYGVHYMCRECDAKYQRIFRLNKMMQ